LTHDTPPGDGPINGEDTLELRAPRPIAIATAAAPMRTAVICPDSARRDNGVRTAEARLDEAVGLARAIALDVRLDQLIPLRRTVPATLLGSGTVARLKDVFVAEEIGLAIVDAALTPIQQRNLEKAWACKVIDRTGLILEIFGERARTHEGRLQVELAALSYQRSRLVRSWTHLERQRGGFGFLGGPGESQLEIDRRLIGDRIVKIKHELDHVRRTRALQRAGRRRNALPTVALVGYTNAGKSTLFNRLAGAGVFARDLLFATLDPTMRALRLPNGRSCVLSDTVGFISDLPTDLVAAFRATLEEVLEADLILHVRDVSHPDTERQRLDVEKVLFELGLEGRAAEGRIIEALNKVDLLPPEARSRLHALAATGRERATSFAISAATGEGIDTLLAAIADRLAAASSALEVTIPASDGATIAWLYRHGEVRARRDDGETSIFTVALDEAARGQLERRLGHGL
jgi:GTP-binding protein HflX